MTQPISISIALRSLLFALVLASQSTVAATVSTLVPQINASGGLTVGPDGQLYVADFGSALSNANGTTVYQVSPTGQVSVFATGLLGASGNDFDADGNLIQANIRGNRLDRIDANGTVTTITTLGLSAPVGVAVAADGTAFVANCGNNTIQRVDPDGTSSVVIGTRLMSCPNGLTLDAEGNLYAANFNDGRVFKITPDRVVTTFAITPSDPTLLVGGNGHITFANNRLYVASNTTHSVYEITLDGTMTLIAGNGQRGHADGPAENASFSRPNGIAASLDGRFLYLNENEDTVGVNLHPNRIRVIELDFPQRDAGFDGAMSGTFAAEGLPDQGLSVHVADQGNGQYLVAAGLFAYDADGNDMWLLGTSLVDPMTASVTMTVDRLSGPAFLDFQADRADRETIGTLSLVAESCDLIRANLNFGLLGLASYQYVRVTGIDGRDCP